MNNLYFNSHVYSIFGFDENPGRYKYAWNAPDTIAHAGNSTGSFFHSLVNMGSSFLKNIHSSFVLNIHNSCLQNIHSSCLQSSPNSAVHLKGSYFPCHTIGWEPQYARRQPIVTKPCPTITPPQKLRQQLHHYNHSH